jgi:hypothetical protein
VAPAQVASDGYPPLVVANRLYGGFLFWRTALENQESQESTQQEQQAQDSLMAGFNKVRGDEPPAEDPPKVDVTEQAQTASAEAETEAKANVTPANTTATESAAAANEDEDPVVPGIGLKTSELKNLLAKASQFDKLQETIEAKVSQRMFGKFGEVQREINQLKSAPTGQALKLTADKLKRMHAEYPEMAAIFAEDLSDVLTAPAGSFTKEQVDAIVSERLTEKSAEVELKLLTIAHPDWHANRHSPDFAIWLTTLPPEVSESVQCSQDSAFLTKAFTGFKAWKGAAQEAKKAADEAASAAAKQKTEKRLEGGITPKGVTTAAPPLPTASSAMQAGFKKVRGP